MENLDPTTKEMTLSSQCECEVEDEETETTKPSDECFGCWEDNLDYFTDEFLTPYLAYKGWTEDTLIRIQGDNIGWLHQSGYKDVLAKDLVEGLSINGDFTLYVSITPENELSVIRSSHDEYRAKFRFELAPENEYDD